MALLQWNVHGFSGVGRKRELLQLVNKYMIKIIGLMETKIRRTNQGKTKKKIFERVWETISNSEPFDPRRGFQWIL